MKKIKFLLLVVALFMSFGCISVSAETGKKPGTITTKEDLIYYIYYYGGMARLDGNTVKLTSSLELAQELSFNNTESVTLDLNGNGIYFSGSDSKIMVYGNAKDVTITDSSNSDRDYIRSQSNFAIYNSSSVGVVTVSNTMLVTNSSLPAIYTYGFSKTNVVNTTVSKLFCKAYGLRFILSFLSCNCFNIISLISSLCSSVKLGIDTILLFK